MAWVKDMIAAGYEFQPGKTVAKNKIWYGDYIYADSNNNGVYGDDNDYTFQKTSNKPKYNFGFQASAAWKGFDLSMFFQGNARVSFFIDPRNTSPFVNYDAGGKTGVQQCLDVIAKDHWSEDNRNIYAFWPRLSPTLVENNMQTSTWWMHDGSFIRLKTVELGYTFSQKALKKIGVQSLRLYLTGSNLLTFSKFKLWDAEMGNNGLGYPIQRVYNLGININF